jgi:hypothetical protein
LTLLEVCVDYQQLVSIVISTVIVEKYMFDVVAVLVIDSNHFWIKVDVKPCEPRHLHGIDKGVSIEKDIRIRLGSV